MEYQYSLVCFTVLGQLAAGLALLVWLAGLRRFPDLERRVWIVTLIFGVIAIIGAITHLDSPSAAFYSVTQLGTSWLSREIVMGGVFGLVVLLRILGLFKAGFNPVIAILGLVFVLVMSQVYYQNGVSPLWNTAGTMLSFLFAVPLLGGAGALALAGGQQDSCIVKAGLGCFVIGALGVMSLPLFWVKAVQSGLDLQYLQTFSTAVICMGLTQMVAFMLGGLILVSFADRKCLLNYIAWLLILAGAIVGRMLFYAAHVKVGL